MNTPRKFAVLLTAAGLFSAARASAQTSTWNLGSTDGTAVTGAFTTATNWNPQTVPTGNASTAIIDNVVGVAHNQTVTYDVSTARSLGTLNLLNSAGGGFTDTLQLTSTGTNTTTSRLTVTNAIALGSTAGTVEIRLTPSATASSAAVLTDAAGLTINSGGLLTLDGTGSSTAFAIVNANTTVNSGGIINVLGNSAAGGIGVNTGNANTLTLNTGGLIAFGAAGASSTGRMQIFGNFTTTGGTITSSAGANIMELYGTNNTIGAGTAYTSPATLTYSLRSATAGSLTSAVDLPNLTLRNGVVNTVTVNSTGQNVGLITIGTTAASSLKLGSNLNTASVPLVAVSGGIDLNGFALNSSATTGSFTPTAGTAALTLTSSTGTGTLTVPAFNFGTSTTVVNSVGANVNLVASASPTGAANLTSTAGTATFNAASTIQFTGNSTSTDGNRLILAATTGTGATSTIGSLVVGTGASTTFLQLGNNPFNIGGNLTVQTGSTLDINARTQTIAGKLQGTGTFTGLITGGLLTFSSTGGLSPGVASGAVGALTLAGAAPLTLIGSSVSIFDLASDTSFDRLAAGNNILTLNGSTLNVNVLNGYNPAVGTTWNILTGLNTGTTGTFGTITSNVSGDTFTFAINNGNGTLTLTGTAVPEPSTWAAGVLVLLALAGRRVFRRNARA